MENLSLTKLKNEFPRAAQRLESYCNREKVDFVADRLNVLKRQDGKLRARVCGGKKWHRVDWDSKNGRWTPHAEA